MNFRYLIFAGEIYYPNGGWDDFRTAMADLESAKKYCQSIKGDWWHIVDLQSGHIILHGGKE